LSLAYQSKYQIPLQISAAASSRHTYSVETIL
jgi:hypothetical protein